MKTQILGSILAIFVALPCCSQPEKPVAKKPERSSNKKVKSNTKIKKMEVVTLGAGCFWCVESVFLELNGVEKVVSGYSGGSVENPTYKEVCTGSTGHAEVAQITFNPSVVSLEEVLEVFFQTHDPTTLNRQGNDAGTQYRSAIFYNSEAQKETSLRIIQALNASKAWDNPIVTEVSSLGKFYPAEDYHQNYFKLNGDQPYCTYVIRPKLDKFRKVFKDKLKH